jgi:hypothetical protein
MKILVTLISGLEMQTVQQKSGLFVMRKYACCDLKQSMPHTLDLSCIYTLILYKRLP